MRAEDKERLARRQRMLARERGEALPDPEPAAPKKSAPAKKPAAPKKGAGVKAPPKAPETKAGLDEGDAPAGVRAPSTIDLLRLERPSARRRRRRRALLVLLLVLLLAVAAVISGAAGSAAAFAGDGLESLSLYLQRGGGWPASTGIRSPLRIEALAGGFVELDSEDVAIYSAYGTKVRTIQPGYARPALAVGNTRFVLYDRGGTSLRTESRTASLDALTTDMPILLCAMSQNGTLAVVTESDRYAAQLDVYNPSLRGIYTWKMTQDQGTPIALAFAADNHRFAAGTVAASGGQLCAQVYLMDTAHSEMGVCYTADAGSLILQLHWLTPSRVLAVFDTYAAVLNASTGEAVARYDFGGATLQGASVNDRTTALLLAVHGGNRLVVLDSDLNIAGESDAGQALGVCCTDTAVYLWDVGSVSAYAPDGGCKWARDLDSRPLAVLNAAQPLLFTAGRVEVLSAVG